MLNKIFAYGLRSLLFLSFPAFAATPQFSDYKVESVYKGENSPLVEINSAGGRWDDLRKSAAGKRVNFAGHYILFTGDCGGASTCGEVIDAETGKVVTSLPNAYQTYDEETEESFDLEHVADSRLAIIMGVAQDAEVDADNKKMSRTYRTRYYEFDGKGFRLITSEDK